MSVVSSRGSPWRIAPAASRKRSRKASCIERSTISRVPARQTCPALSNWFTACFTTASRSASANATNGDFPPSSSDVGVRFAAAACATSFPVSIEPVNAIRSTPGWPVSAAPASSPIPCTTLNAPSGSPASRVMSARSDAVSGAHSGGLATTLLPAASAGAMRHVASISGAFHGVITTVTPDGSHSVRLTNSFISNASSPSSMSWSAKKRKFRATRGMTEFRCERRSEPLSRVSTGASSGTRSSTSSAIRCRTLARSAAEVRPHVSNAPRAAATARSASAGPPRATSAMTCSSIGETSSKVSDEPTRSPPIQCSVETSTPSISAVPPVGAPLLGKGRSVPNDRNEPARMSNDGVGGDHPGWIRAA